MPLRLHAHFTLVLVVISGSVVFASDKIPTSDPQAVALAQQAITALTNGVLVNDVTLTGNVQWTLGSDPENGTVTLQALGTTESRMDLALPSGSRAEIRDASAGVSAGQWIAPNGTTGKFAFHNCQTDSDWFFPALGSLASGPNVVLSYIGPEKRGDVAVQHLRSSVYSPAQIGGADLQKLSTMDFYLDANTSLPVAASFTTHPDDDGGSDITVEVQYSNYQSVADVNAPMRIQKFVQGTLVLDISMSNVTVNGGIPLSTFAIN